jgi:hypothetical protein
LAQGCGGRKLYAVRDKDGKFKDIQSYKKAHGSDVKRKSKMEKSAAERRRLVLTLRRQAKPDRTVTWAFRRDPQVTAFLKTYRAFITSHFGKRCETLEHGCGACQMWKAYDLVDAMIV